MNLVTSPRPVYQPTCELYYVPSSENVKHPGQTPRYYTVTNQRANWRCECKAGQFGRHCWHVDVCVSGAVSPARLKV